MGALLNWNAFRYKFDGREQEAFEKLAYALFCRKYGLAGGAPRKFNQWYIETDPVKVGDDYVSFQAKHYVSPTVNDKQRDELSDTVRNAHKKYPELTVLQIYLANEFSDSKNIGIPKRQEEIEKVAAECGIRIEWVLQSNFEILLNKEDARDLKEYFFLDIYDFFRNFSEQNKHKDLPLIRACARPTCEPYIEGRQRKADLENLGQMLRDSKQAIWLYGEGGIGKTELVLRFAERNPQNAYIFVKFKGSINQTVSRNLFFLPGLEKQGVELQDIVRYEQNLAVLSRYSSVLNREGNSLVLIIDNYDPDDYEETFRDMTELNIDAGFSGEENSWRKGHSDNEDASGQG